MITIKNAEMSNIFSQLQENIITGQKSHKISSQSHIIHLLDHLCIHTFLKSCLAFPIHPTLTFTDSRSRDFLPVVSQDGVIDNHCHL